jgi:hypothetical protein
MNEINKFLKNKLDFLAEVFIEIILNEEEEEVENED